MPAVFGFNQCWRESPTGPDSITISIDIDKPTSGPGSTGLEVHWSRTLSRAVFSGKFKACIDPTGKPFGFIPGQYLISHMVGPLPPGLALAGDTSAGPPDDNTFFMVAANCCTCTSIGGGLAKGETIANAWTYIDGDGNVTHGDYTIGDIFLGFYSYRCRPGLAQFPGGPFEYSPPRNDAGLSITDAVVGNSTTNAEHLITLSGGRFFVGQIVFSVLGMEFSLSSDGGIAAPATCELTLNMDAGLQDTSQFLFTWETSGIRIGYIGKQGKMAQPLPTVVRNSGPGGTGDYPMQAGDATGSIGSGGLVVFGAAEADWDPTADTISASAPWVYSEGEGTITLS